MSKIKLLKLDTVLNGVIRLQSQLLVGQNVADFVLEDGILKNYRHGKNGFDFYETDMEFEIVESREEIFTQTL